MTLPASVIEVCGRIDAASDDTALITAVSRARRFVAEARRDGMPVTRFAHSWSTIVRSAVAAASKLGPPLNSASWTWYVSGSTARDEALPGSDVESILAIDKGSAADLRTAMDCAAEMHNLLDRCGLHRDDRGAIASRARFCRTDAQWSAGIDSWTANPLADRGVVMAGLLADARVVAGGSDDLRQRLGSRIRRHPTSLALVLSDALAVRAEIPSRLRVMATRADEVDLKAAALEPIVQIGRWAALSVGSTALTTIDRLHASAGSRYLSEDDAQVLRECFTILTRIRWHYRGPEWLDHGSVRDELGLSNLPPQDRALVRGAGRELGGIRRKLAYLASTSTFTAG